MWYTSYMCPKCSQPLIPVIYGVVDDHTLRWNKEGKIILMGYKDRYRDSYNSYCLNCDEGSDVWVPRPDIDTN